MLRMQELFNKFCDYVNETIFSKENMGSVVAFVIDNTYISKFCEINAVSEKELMLAVRSFLWQYSSNHLHIKGILAIQMYAASKRANSDGLTSVNYRDRLVQVLDWNIDSLQGWMSYFQDSYWKSLYDWCDMQGFIIAKSSPKYGAGRYVQYPTQQAERVFTEEELLYLACSFHDNHLIPGEDIPEGNFWSIIPKYTLFRYARSSHAFHILYSTEYSADGYTQIYNYYLRWDGSYKSLADDKERKSYSKLDDLYLNWDLTTIEIRDEKFGLRNRIAISELTVTRLNEVYSFKRKGFILFKKNDIYDNYWEETRFLQGEEEGLAIWFIGIGNNYVSGTPIYSNRNIQMFKVTESNASLLLYMEKHYYSLEGGLKVARKQYILGAPPLLRVNKVTKFWVDGTAIESSKMDSLFTLTLGLGPHYIKFPNQPKLEFSIINPLVGEHTWDDEYTKWCINKKDSQWDSANVEEGVVGLDFSCLSDLSEIKENPLSSWSSHFVFGKKSPSDNIILKLLNQM